MSYPVTLKFGESAALNNARKRERDELPLEDPSDKKSKAETSASPLRGERSEHWSPPILVSEDALRQARESEAEQERFDTLVGLGWLTRSSDREIHGTSTFFQGPGCGPIARKQVGGSDAQAEKDRTSMSSSSSTPSTSSARYQGDASSFQGTDSCSNVFLNASRLPDAVPNVFLAEFQSRTLTPESAGENKSASARQPASNTLFGSAIADFAIRETIRTLSQSERTKMWTQLIAAPLSEWATRSESLERTLQHLAKVMRPVEIAYHLSGLREMGNFPAQGPDRRAALLKLESALIALSQNLIPGQLAMQIEVALFALSAGRSDAQTALRRQFVLATFYRVVAEMPGSNGMFAAQRARLHDPASLPAKNGLHEQGLPQDVLPVWQKERDDELATRLLALEAYYSVMSEDELQAEEEILQAPVTAAATQMENALLLKKTALLALHRVMGGEQTSPLLKLTYPIRDGKAS